MNDPYLTVPLFVMLPRKRKRDQKVMLNLNVTRNLHYQVLNQAKAQFSLIVATLGPKVIHDPFPLRAMYRIYPPPGYRRDIDNFAPVVKFTHDALVLCKCLPDDSFKYINGFSMDFIEHDKARPRAELRFIHG